MSEDDDLGGFGDFQGGSPEVPDDPENDDMAQNETDDPSSEELAEDVFELRERVEEVEAETERLEPAGAENPTGVDPVPGKWDLCFDRAKPGARVYVVDVLAESIPDYRENYPTAPELDTYEGNVLSRMREADRVLAAIYVKDTLTSVSYQAYPMPESRLTRLPAEEADLIGNGSVEFARPPVEAEEED